MLRAAALGSRSESWACGEVLGRLQAAVAPSAWQQRACSCGAAQHQQDTYSTASGSDQSSSSSSSSADASRSQEGTAGVAFQQSHRQQSRTGYPQSVAVRATGDTAAAGSGSGSSSSSTSQPPQQALYREVLRVPLRAEEQQEAAEQQVDAYSLSRSLVGGSQQPSLQQVVAADAAPSAVGAAAPGGPARLTAGDTAVLDKLVGILTRDGKKARARRILLDAMHIINRQVNAKGAQ